MLRFSRWAGRVVVVVVVAALVWSADGPTARIEPTQDLPPDVAEALDDAWRRFLLVFGERRACMSDVSLTLARDVPGDARYRLADRSIVIEIPTSPARFAESVVHELAHHMERTCGIEEIRDDFLAAQGFAADVPWYGPAEWEELPTEHFAEAVVDVVLGERLLHADDITLSEAAIAGVLRYAE